jgi:MFS family permease
VQIVVGAAIANFALQGIFQFTAAHFVRQFAVSLGEAGLVIGLIGGLCGGLGTLIGGFGSDWAARRDARWYVWLPAAGLVICAPLYAAAFMQKSWTAGAATLMLPAALSYIFIAPLLSVTQNMVGPRMRATAVALMTLVTASVGVAIGPMAVGWLSDRLAVASFAPTGLGSFETLCQASAALQSATGAIGTACRSASADGVQHAIVASTVLFVWAGVHFFLAARTIRHDLVSAETDESRDGVEDTEVAASPNASP